jgi:hypothetical protein
MSPLRIVSFHSKMRKVSILLTQLAGVTSPEGVPGAQLQAGPLSELSAASQTNLFAVASTSSWCLPLVRASLCPSSGYLTNPFHVCCFLPPLSPCQPSLHPPHPPYRPTTHKSCWCTRFDLLVLLSLPCCFTNVYQTRSLLLSALGSSPRMVAVADISTSMSKNL